LLTSYHAPDLVLGEWSPRLSGGIGNMPSIARRRQHFDRVSFCCFDD
jgi:hypothetical protein